MTISNGLDIGNPDCAEYAASLGRMRAFARGFRMRAWNDDPAPPQFYKTPSLQAALAHGWADADLRIRRQRERIAAALKDPR